MHKKYNLITSIPFDVVTGPIPYNLTNDYMFKVTMQESDEARTGLISALLGINPTLIESEVINPIELGKSIASKDFYLDVKVVVNKVKIMNLEMQVRDWGDWSKRSLSYSFRSYDQIRKGEDYKNIPPFQQVGFVDFDLFEENNRFYDTFLMISPDSSQIYTDNFLLSVVNLRRINEATEKDKKSQLDRWCKLLIASTWEELREIAKEDSYMQATAENLYFFSSDFDLQEEARRREEYYNYVRSLENDLQEEARRREEYYNYVHSLENDLQKEIKKSEEFHNYAHSLESDLQKEIKKSEEYHNYAHSLENDVAMKDAALAKQAEEIAELKKRLSLLQ